MRGAAKPSKYVKKPSRGAAFTLAEVLITLAIIGVVAALTLPSLISNYRKQALVNQLKKSVNTIENGFRLAMAHDGVDDLTQTQLWNAIPEPKFYMLNFDSSGAEFLNELGKYIKILKVEYDYSKFIYSIKCLGVNDFVSGDYQGGIYLVDGSVIIDASFSRGPSLNGNYIGRILIDVNGEKGPNTWGRDVFSFYISKDGRVVPYYSKAYAIAMGATEENYKSSDYYWNKDGTMEKCDDSSLEYKVSGKITGWGCMARIIEEGWKMNY